MFDPLIEFLELHTVNLLIAVSVLVVGWFVAALLGYSIEAGLNKLGLHKKCSSLMKLDEKNCKAMHKYIGKAVYYVLLVGFVMWFLIQLRIPEVSDPLFALMLQLQDNLPLVITPIVLLVAAWIIATILKYVVSRVLTAFKVEERFHNQIEDEKSVAHDVNITKTLSETVYWLVFLLFLPAILDALKLDGLLQPVQGMLERILAFVPNLAAAVLIFAVGWFFARVAQKIVHGLLVSVGADRLSEKVGLHTVLGDQRLSGVLALLVYILILIPVLVASLNALALEAITAPASEMLKSIFTAIPHLFAAALLLVIAYVVAKVLSKLVVNFLGAVGFDRVFNKLGLLDEQSKVKYQPSEVVGYLLVTVVMLFASVEALNLVGFMSLGSILSEFIEFLGQIILGLIIFAIGLYLANFVSDKILHSAKKQPKAFALLARVAILVLAGAMSLRQMGIADEIIQLAFGALVGALAVAAALAFGLGGRDTAAQFLQDWKNNWKS